MSRLDDPREYVAWIAFEGAVAFAVKGDLKLSAAGVDPGHRPRFGLDRTCFSVLVAGFDD